ncbi:MAG: ABC transporter permease [Betaproteobacteria bacterium]|nr:ABC transporter permease [Betaproteobacteria bacterium]
MSREQTPMVPYGLAAPATLAVALFVAVPLLLTFALSFHPFLPSGQVGHGTTLANYVEIGSDSYYGVIFARTFAVALMVTAICMLIGVPEAYVLSRLSKRWRTLSLLLVLGPLLVSVIVRTLGWAILLGAGGLLDQLVRALGISDRPAPLMYTYTGVVIALVHVLVPYMVLAVWASLQRIDPATEQAAESLGAGTSRVLWRIVLPQIVPGVLSGGLIVFALSASAFATPAIIGGRRLKVVPMSIYEQFLNTLNWPLGAALAAALVLLVVGISMGLNRVVERRFRQVFQ